MSSPQEPSEEARARPGRKRTWQVVKFVVGIALGALAIWAVSGHRGELAGASAELSHLDVGWLTLAIVVEVLSLVAFARMEQRLLRCGGVRAGTGRLTVISFAAGAIASSLPAGPLLSSAFGFRQFRRLGASESLAVWTLLATLIFAALGLALLATAGVVVAAQQGSALDLAVVIPVILVVTIAGTALVYQKRALFGLLERTIRIGRKVPGFRRPPGEFSSSIMGGLGEVTLRKRDLGDVLSWSIASWSLDCACLVFSYLAVGAAVPWRGLLLAYGAGQLAANLPITPGGLGVVEGSLVIALVAFGGGQVNTVAAVLLYRIMSFWGFLPLGWLAWGGLTWRNRRVDQLAALTSVSPEVAPVAPPEPTTGLRP